MLRLKAKQPKLRLDSTPFALFNNLNSSVVTKTEYFIKERKTKPLEVYMEACTLCSYIFIFHNDVYKQIR